MPIDKKDPVTKKIIDFASFIKKRTNTQTKSKKRPISVTSLPESNKTSKKPNRDIHETNIGREMEETDKTPSCSNAQQATGLKELLTPPITHGGIGD